MKKVAVYARNPALVLHPILRIELLKSIEDFKPANDDDIAVDITDHAEEIDSSWMYDSAINYFESSDTQKPSRPMVKGIDWIVPPDPYSLALSPHEEETK